MGSYKDFHRCVICRSWKIFEEYEKTKDKDKDKFEVTMLLNTLYLTVIHMTEKVKKDKKEHKSEEKFVKKIKCFINEIANYLKNKDIKEKDNNDFDEYQILCHLRNGLAHLNIAVEPIGSKEVDINEIKIFSINSPNKPMCEKPCKSQKCKPKQYKDIHSYTYEEKVIDSICTFSFKIEPSNKLTGKSINKLRNFVDFFIKNALQYLGDAKCGDCQYK
jgi:hypothetical protein